MKYLFAGIAALSIASAIGISSLIAQDQAPAQPKGEDNAPAPFVSQVTRVNMLFTVTDKHGRFVTDLGRNDFEVFENKKQQEIAEFTSESDLPLRLGILVDTSNSIRDRFHFQQEAAINFINGVMRSQDKAMLVSFDSSAELVADLTSDTGTLEKGIRDMRPGGGTSFYDAIFYACRDKLRQDQPMYKFRRAMIVLSDGQDNNSKVSRDQALEMAQKADVVVYTISTNISRQETEGDKVLRYFAQQTGGVAFFPFQASDLNQSFENIANELRHQYNLFYRPNPLVNDGLFHNVNIRVRGKKDFVVRARKGYYARRSS